MNYRDFLSFRFDLNVRRTTLPRSEFLACLNTAFYLDGSLNRCVFCVISLIWHDNLYDLWEIKILLLMYESFIYANSTLSTKCFSLLKPFPVEQADFLVIWYRFHIFITSFCYKKVIFKLQ